MNTNQDKSAEDADGWMNLKHVFPQNDRVVETKIDEGRGVRNIARLRRWQGQWWFPDGSVHAYYEPTHWREVAAPLTANP